MAIDLKAQTSFRINPNENARIAVVEQRFPAENYKDLFLKLIEYAERTLVNGENTNLTELENKLRELGEYKIELQAQLTEYTEKVNVLQEENTTLNTEVQRLQALHADTSTNFNGLKTEYENIEKEFVIHPNPEQVKRLYQAKAEVGGKYKVVFNSTSEFLEQLIDMAMDKLDFKYAELK